MSKRMEKLCRLFISQFCPDMPELLIDFTIDSLKKFSLMLKTNEAFRIKLLLYWLISSNDISRNLDVFKGMGEERSNEQKN